MRGIKLDPETRTVSYVEVHTLEDMQAVVGGYIEPVRSPMLPGHVLLVNEEARLRMPTSGAVRGFAIDGFNTPLIGPGLILRSKDTDFVSVTCAPEDIERIMVWTVEYPQAQAVFAE